MRSSELKTASGTLWKRVSLLLCLGFLLMTGLPAQNLQEGFQNPPQEAGIRCWWWWLNSNVTKESITRDLEAMYDKGYSGAMIFDAGTELNWGPDENVPNGPMFSGSEWIELFQRALKEASRLNLELGLSIQSGWNLGGHTVSLDQAAKQITWSETTLTGGQAIEPIRFLDAKTGSRELGGSAPDCRFFLDDFPSVAGEAEYAQSFQFSHKEGSNELKITVVNNWHNLLIGERGKPKNERQVQTNIRIREDWVLQSSGLLGPVQIITD